MEIRNLITFVSVCELGSFTRAGEALGYSQSTVSFQIKQLETELNCSLFDRINHTVRLTEKGRELLDYAHEITRLTMEFNQSIRSELPPSDEIHIVSPDSLCQLMMEEHYEEFYKRYPHIRLRFTTADTVEMFNILDRNEADIMLTLDNYRYKAGYVIVKEERIGMHFVTAADSPYATKRKPKLEDMKDFPFILTERGVSYRRAFDEALAKRAVEISPILELGRTDVITEILSHGIGVSFLPDIATNEYIESGKLVYLDVEDCGIEIWKQLIYHKNKWVSRGLKALIDFICEKEFSGNGVG